jgi:Zn-dependent peptidase ImmA (M78 family)/transcriptional regulator with XRE-family HTH domain
VALGAVVVAKKEKSKTPNNPALITGDIITWARQRLGYSYKQVADEIGASVTADDIAQWEAEKALPDFRKAQKLATALHIPFGYLFLSHRPKNDVRVPDLRTVGSKPITEFTPNLLDQLRNLLLKQEWYRDYATEEVRKPLSFVGRFNVNSTYEKVAADIANELGIDSQFRAAASNWEGFLTNFMANAEAAGILVIRSGVVASASQRPLSVKEFRGFVLSDPIAPLVFINGADSTSAQVFTLAHELVHLWIGKSGISNQNPKKRSTDETNTIERFCNQVAAELLVPHAEFLRRWRGTVTVEENVKTLVRYFRVSTHVILRQAFEQDKVSRQEYEERIQAEEDRFKAQQEEREGGGNFYRTMRVRNSRILVSSVLEAIQASKIGLRDAATLLGCKVPTLKNVASELS